MSKSWGTISYSKHKLGAQDWEGKQIYYIVSRTPKSKKLAIAKSKKRNDTQRH